MENQSRQPHASPNMIIDDIITALLFVRGGPMKLLWRLEKDHPEYKMPSYASVARILKRNGYIKKRRKRTRRPHQAIGMKPPADLYKSSLRTMPDKLPQIQCPAHYEVRKVSRNGGIRWTSGWVNLGQVLREEYVGLVEIDDGVWDVTFGPLWLGLLDEKNMKIKDIECRLERNPKRQNSVTYVLR